MFESIRRAVFKRRQAYRGVFAPGGLLSPAAEIVMEDLRKFCRATTSTVVINPTTGMVDERATFVAEGRREVWLRITQHLNISDADLYRIMERDQEQQIEQET
jgi:hypothetical protein